VRNRNLYLKQLIAFRDKSPVKVVTGVRRCGKSTLLDLYEQHLLATGVPKDAVIRMNFESLHFDEIRTYMELHDTACRLLRSGCMNYILLDEAQQVEHWEKAVNSLRLLPNTDICVTGSNAYMLSSELSTLLAGRYVEIRMLPLSFREYLDFSGYDGGDPSEHFNRYLRCGGFPVLAEFGTRAELVRPYLSGVYNTILMRDVIQRNAVRDAALLESVVRFLCGNIGNATSTKKISDYLTSAGRKTNSETIDNYLRMLENAFILYRARRYDLKGKLHLKTQEKFYLVDTGIRNELLGFRDSDYGSVLENVVYFELLRRGFDVSIGKLGALEVDFVAVRPDKTAYYQVAASLLNDDTRRRELEPLRGIADNYEKTVLSMDRTPVTDFYGIRNVNLLDFLLEEET
jgi:predicted AAA+ superfamily ATPase